MKQYIHPIFIIIALSLCFKEASGQPSFDFLRNNTRIEQENAVFLLIGAEGGRNFVRALNNRAQPVKITLELGELNNAQTGLTTTSEQNIRVPAFEKSDTIYLSELTPDPAWITGWSVESESNDRPLALVTRDAEPFHRAPPRFPDDCMDENIEREAIVVEFGISAIGATQDIRIKNVTHGCFALAAHNAVRKWVYSAKLVAGRAEPRPGVITQLTFVLED